jgi:hypothetical protein
MTVVRLVSHNYELNPCTCAPTEETPGLVDLVTEAGEVGEASEAKDSLDC